MEVEVCVCSGVVRMVFNPKVRISNDIKIERNFKKEPLKNNQKSLLEGSWEALGAQKIALGGVLGGPWRLLASKTEGTRFRPVCLKPLGDILGAS